MVGSKDENKGIPNSSIERRAGGKRPWCITPRMELLLWLLFYISFYAMMLHVHYSSDSYTSTAEYNGQNLRLGRWTCYVINLLVTEVLKFDYVQCQWPVTLFLMLALSIGSWKLHQRFTMLLVRPSVKQQMLLCVGIALSFANVFVAEWFVYVEMDLFFGLAVLLSVGASLCITKTLCWENVLKSMVLLILAMNTYQAVMGYYVIFSMLCLFAKYKGQLTAKNFWHNAVVMLVGVISVVINLLSVRVCLSMGIVQTADRTGNLNPAMLWNNLVTVVDTLPDLFITALGMMPSYTVLAVCLIQLALLFYALQKRKTIPYAVLIITASFLIVIAPHFVTTTVWMAQRTVASFWAFMAVPVILLALYSNGQYRSFVQLAATCLGVGMLLLNAFQVQAVAIDVIACNRLDRELALQIQYYITRYEEQSNEKVTRIGVLEDASLSYRYATAEFRRFDVYTRPYAIEGGGVKILNFYLGTNYEQAQVPQEVEEHFAGQNWNVMALDEQCLFEGNTLYIAIY